MKAASSRSLVCSSLPARAAPRGLSLSPVESDPSHFEFPEFDTLSADRKPPPLPSKRRSFGSCSCDDEGNFSPQNESDRIHND